MIQPAIHHMMEEPGRHVSSIIRVMALIKDSDAWILARAIELAGVVDRDQRYMVVAIARMVSRAKFIEPTLLNDALGRMIGEVSIGTTLSDINQQAHLNSVLVQLAGLPLRVRNKLSHEIDEIVEAVSHKSRGTLLADGSSALAKLIEGASAHGGVAYLRACVTALAFSMDAPQHPMSPLIVVSFPAVYCRQVVAAYVVVIALLLLVYFLGSRFVRWWNFVEIYYKDKLPRTWSDLAFELRFTLQKLRKQCRHRWRRMVWPFRRRSDREKQILAYWNQWN